MFKAKLYLNSGLFRVHCIFTVCALLVIHDMASPQKIDRKAVSQEKRPSSYTSFFLEYSLMAEYNQLHKQNLHGVYVIPSAKSPLLWFGVIFVRQGLYQSGIFKFCIVIPATYPDSDCPQIIFDHSPFHPLIDPKTGELDVKRAFPSWKRNVNHIWNILLYTRRIFYKIETDSPLNPDAARCYQNELTRYKSSVLKSIELNHSHLYDKPRTNDPHEIKFVASDQTTTIARKKAMVSTLHDSSFSHEKPGLSWVAQGTSMPFSKNYRVT